MKNLKIPSIFSSLNIFINLLPLISYLFNSKVMSLVLSSKENSIYAKVSSFSSVSK
jgi:hypothetical protein